MQMTAVKLLDVVALLVEKPQDGLVVGQVGTVVEVLGPDVFEVEFLDSNGKTIAVTELKRPEVLVLKHEPAVAA
jgi:catabolite regulation protein CreA